ncbi:MAG: 4-hydroxy-tetrahydrodipicolinate synthase [bacterium]
MKDRIRGSMTALITPFAGDGSVDLEALDRLVAHQLAGGTDVLVPLGSTGEAMTLTDGEKREVVRRVREAAGEVPIAAGAGSNSTAAAVEQCALVAEEGADYALVVGPYYNKPPQEGYLRHFEAVAEASPIPLIVYNVPGRTGSNILPDTVLELAGHPNIAGVKEASGSLAQAAAILADRPEGFRVLSGEDDLILPMMVLGGDGIISVAGNAAPGLLHRLTEACRAGRWEEAREIHFSLRPLFIAQFTETNPIPIKAAAEMLGLCGPGVRLPLVPATPDAREEIRQALHHAGLIDGTS